MGDWIYRTDLWVIFIYMVSMLVVAWRVSGSSRDVEGYTVGNRSMPGWAIGLSVLGTFTSSISFLALPATTYATNWNAFVFSMALPVSALIAVLYFVPLYRQKVRFSAYEFLEARFGYWARAYVVVSYVVLQIIRVAMVLLLVALAVAPLLEWQIIPTLILLGTLVIIYDTLGGIQAVIWTDVIQVVILLVGALWCLFALTFGLPGGISEFIESVPLDRISLGVWDKATESSKPWWDVWYLGQSTILVVLVYGISENLRNYGTDQNYVQRMLAARSDREAAKSLWIGSWAYLPISVMFCLIGTALWVNYPTPPMIDGEALSPDKVFPYFIHNQLPLPVAGLVIGAIMAAAMSTVDSSLNSSSTVVFIDLVRRLGLKPNWMPDILVLRGLTITLGIVGTVAAIAIYQRYLNESETIMRMWWTYAGVAGGGMFGLFLLAWLFPRTPNWAAATGVLLSIPMLIWGILPKSFLAEQGWEPWACPLHGNLVGVAGTLVILMMGLLGVQSVRMGWSRPNPKADPVVDETTAG